jgi:chorismate mutase
VGPHLTAPDRSQARRYTSPDEKPFTPRDKLPPPVLPALEVPENMRYLVKIDVNINDKIYDLYEKTIVPMICKEGNDGQYGSTATADILVLQVLFNPGSPSLSSFPSSS